MALDTQYIQLDISKQPTPQQVRLGQGDANATQLVVSIFDDGEAYSLTGYSVRLCMRLPKNGGYYDVDGTKSGNVATFDIDESYAASVSGFDGFGYVDILDGDEVICSTSRFQLVVLQCASEGVELSPQYSDAINAAIDRAVAAAEAAEGVVLQDVPTMSATVKGGALLGSGLAVSGDTLSLGPHVHSASDITSGALPVANGGTGSTTAADARTALGVYSTSEVNTALAGKAAASHTHAKADITDFGSYLPLSGGTLTGNLTVANATPYMVLKDTDLESNVTSSGETDYLAFRDKNDVNVGRVNVWISGGVQYMRYITSRTVSGTAYNNILNLGIDGSGNAVVSLGNAIGSGSAWRNAIGATGGVWNSGTLINTGWTYAAGSASAAFYVRWCKIGHVVHVEVYGTKSMTANASTTLSTTAIPSGSRPSKEADSFLYSSQDHIGALWVDTSGNVSGIVRGAAASAIYGSVSYPVI